MIEAFDLDGVRGGQIGTIGPAWSLEAFGPFSGSLLFRDAAGKVATASFTQGLGTVWNEPDLAWQIVGAKHYGTVGGTLPP